MNGRRRQYSDAALSITVSSLSPEFQTDNCLLWSTRCYGTASLEEDLTFTLQWWHRIVWFVSYRPQQEGQQGGTDEMKLNGGKKERSWAAHLFTPLQCYSVNAFFNLFVVIFLVVVIIVVVDGKLLCLYCVDSTSLKFIIPLRLPPSCLSLL